MSELIERYVHQVGLYVRLQERAEIERELRSQIQDQLEDGYGASPDSSATAAVLKQLGDPRTMAASYGGEQYLVGPDLYPFLLVVLRIGLPLVPAVVVVANVVSAALTPGGSDWVGLLAGSIFTAVQAALLFFAVVVIIFAVLQHSSQELSSAMDREFNPLELPAVNDPAAVDRVESGVGIAIGTLILIAIAYWLQVGGLTLRFNLSDPGEVLPAPVIWLVVLLISTAANVLLHLGGLLRRRWTLGMWLAQAVVDVVGAVGLYFAIFMPLVEQLIQTQPELAVRLPLAQIPGWLILFMVVLMVLVNGGKLIRMWQYQQGAAG